MPGRRYLKVCKFYEQGRCIFGEECWYEHPAKTEAKTIRTGYLRVVPDSDDSSDSSDSDSDKDIYGFSKEDAADLISYGVKPWDPHAHKTLAIIRQQQKDD